jgi:hypothetical protein
VQGPGAEADYPTLAAESAEGAPELLIPRDAWLQAFKLGTSAARWGLRLLRIA